MAPQATDVPAAAEAAAAAVPSARRVPVPVEGLAAPAGGLSHVVQGLRVKIVHAQRSATGKPTAAQQRSAAQAPHRTRSDYVPDPPPLPPSLLQGAYNPNTHETKFELKCNLDGDDIMLHAVINTYNAELTGEGWAILIRDREDIWDEKKWKREQEEKEKADLVTDSDVEAKE